MSAIVRRRVGLVLAVLAAVVLLANRLLLREANGPFAAAEPTPDPVALALEGDSSGAAQAALDRCTGTPDPIACYQKLLVAATRRAGPRPAMTALSRLGALDENARREGHQLAHAIGIEAYKAAPQVSRTFAACTEIFQSGCYHGVIQAYFEDIPALGAQEVNAVCADYTDADADWWLRFQCVHGLGHGLTMFHHHHLLRALGGCDLLADGWDRDACYGGAFMENIVNATHPHHPGAALRVGSAGDSAGSGHAHGGHASAKSAAVAGGHAHATATEPFKALEPEDLHYPCSILEPRYLVACYQMQTSVMLHFNGGDIGQAARTCDGAPEGLRAACYQSLGRDVSSYSAQDHAEAVRLCSLGSERWQPWCFVGVVKNFVDITARSEDGMAFCRKVPDGPSRLLCYVAVGEEIAVLENGTEGREALCTQAAEEPYRVACRYGARTVVAPPAGLPHPG